MRTEDNRMVVYVIAQSKIENRELLDQYGAKVIPFRIFPETSAIFPDGQNSNGKRRKAVRTHRDRRTICIVDAHSWRAFTFGFSKLGL